MLERPRSQRIGALCRDENEPHAALRDAEVRCLVKVYSDLVVHREEPKDELRRHVARLL